MGLVPNLSADPTAQYPRWLHGGEDINLRAVGPLLLVGATRSPGVVPVEYLGGIVDLYGDSPDSKGVGDLGVPRLACTMLDGNAIPAKYMDAALVLWRQCREQGKPLLVHCQAGLSRSASMAYGLLRVEERLTHPEALRRVQTPKYAREFPRPATLASARTWARNTVRAWRAQ
jgi:hypothetical protein